MLALGTGASTAIFSLVNALYLKTLPIREPGRFVRITGEEWLTTGVWEHVRDHQPAFESVAAAGTDRFTLTRGGIARHATALAVSGGFFDLLGIAPVRGRLLSGSDEVGGAPAVAVVSHGLWQRDFGGTGDVVGATLWLENLPFEIVGVLPRGFVGIDVGRSVDVIVPIAALAAIPNRAPLLRPDAAWLHVFARLRPNQTIDEAAAALREWQPALADATRPAGSPGRGPGQHLGRPLGVAPAATGISEVRAQFGPAMLVLFGLVGVVMLVACVNLAALVFVRSVDRQHDLGVRRALGASEWDLARVLLVENTMLVSAGALLGGILASWVAGSVVPHLTTAAFRHVSPYLDVSPDWRVLGVTAGLTLLGVLVAAALPASRAARAPACGFSSGIRTSTGSRGASRAMRGLLAGQLALSLGVFAAAALLGRSFVELTSQEIGFEDHRVTIVTVAGDLGPSRDAQLRAIGAVRRRLQAIPGVEEVAGSMVTPISGQRAIASLSVPGFTSVEPIDSRVLANRVSSGHFRVYGTPLLAGRDFDERDTGDSRPVAIVNRAFADRYVGGQDPVGRMILLNNRETTVIGLAANAKHLTLREAAQPFVYAPISQWAFTTVNSLRFSVRTRGPAPAPAAVADSLRRLDPAWSLEVRPLNEDVRRSVNVERLLAACAGVFALLAVSMCVIGTSGVFAYSVARRRREIGVRLALGATPGAVVRLLMHELVAVMVAGAVTGLLGAWLAGRLIQGFLFQVSAADPAMLSSATIVILGAAGAAAAVPAVRASRLHPARVLRGE
jgi:predicted permease